MAPRALKSTAKTSSKKHIWTAEDRTLLAVINKFYDTSRQETAMIFNQLLCDRLAREGLTDGLPETTIEAQINDLRRTARGQHYRQIQSMSLHQARNELQAQKHEVRAAAQSLGISLKLCLHATEPQKTSTLKRSAMASRDDWSSDSDPGSDTTGRKENIPCDLSRNKRLRSEFEPIRTLASPKVKARTRAKRESTEDTMFTSTSYSSLTTDSCSLGSWVTDSETDTEDNLVLDDDDFAVTAKRINPRLRLQFNSEGKLVQTRPRLLFRAFNPNHRLRARRFLAESTDIPAPPDYDTAEFHDIVTKHLFEDKTFASPFISFTESPTRALEIIAKAKCSLSLAIIDYNELEADMKRRFGCGNGLWLVPVICRDHGLDRLTRIHDDRASRPKSKDVRYYTGTGEFVTWGSVECPTAAILSARQARRVQDYMDSVAEISHESGRALVSTLRGVRDIYKEVFAYKLLRAFRVPGYLRGCNGLRYEEFARGINGEPSILDEDDCVEIKNHEMSNLPPYKADATFAESPRKAKGTKITVEVSAKAAQEPTNKQSISAQRSDSLMNLDADVQSLVDRQLSQMGAVYGITVESPSASSAVPNDKVENISLNNEEVITSIHSWHGIPSDQGGKLVIEEEKTEEAIKELDVVYCPEDTKGTPDIEPDVKFDGFIQELLEHAQSPTPTPPSQTVFGQGDNVVKTRLLAKDEPPKSANFETTLQAKTRPREQGKYKNSAVKIDSKSTMATAQSRAPGIMGSFAENSSDSKQTKTDSKKTVPPQIKKHIAPGLPTKPPSSRTFIDLTTDVDEDDEELAVIAEAKVSNRRYVRTTTRTRTTTLTVRSRSMSEIASFYTRK